MGASTSYPCIFVLTFEFFNGIHFFVLALKKKFFLCPPLCFSCQNSYCAFLFWILFWLQKKCSMLMSSWPLRNLFVVIMFPYPSFYQCGQILGYPPLFTYSTKFLYHSCYIRLDPFQLFPFDLNEETNLWHIPLYLKEILVLIKI